MTRTLYAVLAGVLLASSTGCCLMDKLLCHHWGCGPWGGRCGSGEAGCNTGAAGCSSCGDAEGGCASCGHGHGLAGRGIGHGAILNKHHAQRAAYPRGAGGEQLGASGPPTAAVTYPYYTNRGPRDFLDPNPTSIGP